jgi:hypothetical protein
VGCQVLTSGDVIDALQGTLMDVDTEVPWNVAKVLNNNLPTPFSGHVRFLGY